MQYLDLSKLPIAAPYHIVKAGKKAILFDSQGKLVSDQNLITKYLPWMFNPISQPFLKSKVGVTLLFYNSVVAVALYSNSVLFTGYLDLEAGTKLSSELLDYNGVIYLICDGTLPTNGSYLQKVFLFDAKKLNEINVMLHTKEYVKYKFY